MKQNALLAVVLLLGASLGWFMRGSVVMPPPEARSPAPATKASSRGPARQADPRVKAETARILAGEPGTWETWESSELKDLIAALLAESDPVEGLPSPLRDSLDRILEALASRDLEGTLAWIDRMFPKQRYDLYRKIIGVTLGDRSPIERVAFMEAHGFDSDEVSNYAGNQLSLWYERPMDHKTAIALLSKVKPREEGGGAGASPTQFATDFDFAEFARSVLTMAESNGGRPPRYFPSNFISQWATESPQEAIDFYFGHCVGENALEIFHNGLPQLLAGVKTSMNSDDYATWLGQTMSRQAQGEDPDMDLVSSLFYSELSHPDLLRSALTRIEDPAVRSKLIQEAVKGSVCSSSSPDGLLSLRNSLALIDDPAERLAQSEAGFRDASERFGKTDIPQIVSQYEQLTVNLRKELLRLGHTEEEMTNLRVVRSK